ncbi:hypothetical protein GCM10025867_47220 (plasmid) [Frondihabitans sucicola]|uniref:DUF4340 domain-containing protein n=1 Tax=Frondihabitans sucicola TaxID=1268041 RepID=A0ABM8GVP2_9MICO|nr:hypothetical protein [Frondihabitans sucicola]BDZ52481.1 hypothetical protein GCM10025867_47220 [Frondihabitans sucicola]
MTNQPQHADRRSRKPAILVASIVTVLCLGTGAIVYKGVTSAPPVQHASFESLVPASAGAVASLAPSSASWKLLGSIDAPLALGVLDYSKLPSKPSALGVSVSKESGTAGRTEVYLDFTTTKAASSTLAWLGKQDGADQRAVAVRAKTILVTDPTAGGVKATDGFAQRKPQESPEVKADFSTRLPGSNRLWFDFDRLNSVVTLAADSGRRSIFEKFQADSLGMSRGTRWIGSTSNVDDAWKGSFTAGGYSVQALKPSDAVASLVATQSSGAAGTTDTTKRNGAVSIGSAGMSSLLDDLSITYRTGTSRIDKESFAGQVAAAWPTFLPAKPEIEAIIPTGAWIATGSGLTEVGQGITTVALAFDAGKLSVGLVQNSSPTSSSRAGPFRSRRTLTARSSPTRRASSPRRPLLRGSPAIRIL